MENTTLAKRHHTIWAPQLHVQHQIYFEEIRNQIARSTPHLFQTYIPESVPSTIFYLSPTIEFSIERTDNKNTLLQNEWTGVLRLWMWALKPAGTPNEQARSKSCLRVPKHFHSLTVWPWKLPDSCVSISFLSGKRGMLQLWTTASQKPRNQVHVHLTPKPFQQRPLSKLRRFTSLLCPLNILKTKGSWSFKNVRGVDCLWLTGPDLSSKEGQAL